MKLNKGDRVEICAPGYGEGLEELEKSAKYIESWGLQPTYPKDIFGEDLFCSNNDSYRASHFMEAIADDEVKAIWCLRGGYGSSRIIDEIEALKKPKSPKLLIGFSDITVLHIHLNQEWNWPSLHGPVLWQVVNDKVGPESLEELRQVMMGEKEEIFFDSLTPINITANRDKPVKGAICGGNLALVAASLGTDWQIDTKNKILFLEEVGEKAYRIDRLLVQLEQAGILGDARALLLGDFIDDDPKIESALTRFAHQITTPVYRIGELGHGRINRPLPFNTDAIIEFGDSVSLKVKGF